MSENKCESRVISFICDEDVIKTVSREDQFLRLDYYTRYYQNENIRYYLGDLDVALGVSIDNQRRFIETLIQLENKLPKKTIENLVEIFYDENVIKNLTTKEYASLLDDLKDFNYDYLILNQLVKEIDEDVSYLSLQEEIENIATISFEDALDNCSNMDEIKNYLSKIQENVEKTEDIKPKTMVKRLEYMSPNDSNVKTSK